MTFFIPECHDYAIQEDSRRLVLRIRSTQIAVLINRSQKTEVLKLCSTQKPQFVK